MVSLSGIFPLSDLADLFLWGPPVGIPGITEVVLNRFGRIPFLGFDRVGDWPDVWTTGIWTHWNGFGFDFWPRPNKGKFEATGAAGFKASYVGSFTCAM